MRADSMSNDLHQMTQDLQTRIRELAYLMWESAGRQHGAAMEYWLKAESEVLSTLQAAARILPGAKPAKSTKPEAGTPASVVEPAPVAPADPAAASIEEPTKPATRGGARPATRAAPAESSSARKPAAKFATRDKTKT
jgi:DUF2934 family protein